MSDNKKIRPKNINAVKLTDKELENVSGGKQVGYLKLACFLCGEEMEGSEKSPCPKIGCDGFGVYVPSV